MSKPVLLVVDDDPQVLAAVRRDLRSKYREGYTVVGASSGQEALTTIRELKSRGNSLAMVISDQRMPGMLGVELLRRAREISPDSVRILLTGYSDLASIVGSINDGEVYRFISKPWDNQELQNVIAEATAIGAKMLDRSRTQLKPPAALDAAILVLDDKREVYSALDRMAADQLELLYAKSIQEALTLLENKEVAVLVADIDMEAENYLVFFNLLKSKYPQILVVVVTSASDSELVIHLINEAQIYRFLNKPVNLTLMHQYLHSALGRYAEYKTAPELLERYRVNESKSLSSGFGQMLVQRLRSLKSAFALQAK